MFQIALVAFLSSGWMMTTCPRVLEKSVATSLTETRIGDDHFLHRIELDNGKRSQEWRINGSPVSAQDYEETLLEAEKEERRKELRRKEKRMQQDITLHDCARADIVKKLLSRSISEVRTHIDRLHEYGLHEYYHFSPHTVLSQGELDELFLEQLPYVESLVSAASGCSSYELSHALERLEQWPDRLQQFFNDTLKDAVQRCDDTQRLKRLLDLLS